jgi:hypothetical protein
VYRKVDTEAPRFLEFERWWGGFFLMNKEEIEWIVQNLFVGNKLRAARRGSPRTRRRSTSERSSRRSWCSPPSATTSRRPPQALNWILDLYENVEELMAYEQTIVYCLHETVGHLGIFVSGKVANRETHELVSTLELVDLLPPGLYEAIIDDATDETEARELVEGQHVIRFEPRTLRRPAQARRRARGRGGFRGREAPERR